MLKLAKLLKSDQAAVLILLLGTVAQSLHTYNIMVYSSRLTQLWQIHLQAIIVSLFFSLSLSIYTLRAGNVKEISKQIEYKNYANAIFIFEFLVNSHYWTRDFLIVKINDNINISLLDWYDWSITIIYGFFLPYMIKTYAGHIKIDNIINRKKIKYFNLNNKDRTMEIEEI
jgi:hypothetical protein